MLGFNCPFAKCAELGSDFLYDLPEEMQAALFRECLLPSYGPLGGVVGILSGTPAVDRLGDWLAWYSNEYRKTHNIEDTLEYRAEGARIMRRNWCFNKINQDLFPGCALVDEGNPESLECNTRVVKFRYRKLDDQEFEELCLEFLYNIHKVSITRR